jgi:hypothetical protein
MLLPEGTLREQNDKTELEYLVNCLQSVFNVIIEEAVDMKQRELKTKNKYKNKKESYDAAFESGCVYGYYRVLELIRQHIEADGIPLSVFSLNNVDLDKKLLRNE